MGCKPIIRVISANQGIAGHTSVPSHAKRPTHATRPRTARGYPAQLYKPLPAYTSTLSHSQPETCGGSSPSHSSTAGLPARGRTSAHPPRTSWPLDLLASRFYLASGPSPSGSSAFLSPVNHPGRRVPAYTRLHAHLTTVPALPCICSCVPVLLLINLQGTPDSFLSPPVNCTA